LNWPRDVVQPIAERRAIGPGNILVATLAFEHVTEVCVAFGRVGASAEKIAEECAAQVKSYLLGDHPVGPHLADQLLLPLALGAGGAFVTCTPSPHMLTNMAIIEAFLGEKMTTTDLGDANWRVLIR
jgi:RNA 3'-terminal phosphate cyclase (ATP)